MTEQEAMKAISDIIIQRQKDVGIEKLTSKDAAEKLTELVFNIGVDCYNLGIKAHK